MDNFLKFSAEERTFMKDWMYKYILQRYAFSPIDEDLLYNIKFDINKFLVEDFGLYPKDFTLGVSCTSNLECNIELNFDSKVDKDLLLGYMRTKIL